MDRFDVISDELSDAEFSRLSQISEMQKVSITGTCPLKSVMATLTNTC